MPILKTQVDVQSASFKANKTFAQEHAQKVRQALEDNLTHKNHNKKFLQDETSLSIQARITLLLDPESDFLELSPLAGWHLYEEPLPYGGIITGIGKIHAIDCMIIANDPNIKGGTYYPITIKKHLRALTIALENQLPCVYLVDSGGANLPHQDNVFPDKEHFGRIFYQQAQLSAKGIPQIAVVLGSCTAGGAYIPAMADENIMVKNKSTLFLAGPPLVKAAIKEVVTAEALGGADLHCQISGVSDHYAQNETHALMIARDCLKYHPTTQMSGPAYSPPLYDAKALYGLIPTDHRQPVPMKEIIARIVDGSEFHEFKTQYGQTLICGFAMIYGITVGIIANNGILFSASALKGAHFIEICAKRKIPLVFLQNITGFMVGKEAEAKGITKDGAKMVMAVANAQVPKFTVIVGASYGAGNYAMCGRAYDPRFLWMWPTAHIAVMGGEQAAQTLWHIKSKKEKKTADIEQVKKDFLLKMTQQYETQSSAFYSTARLWDDGIILPCQTRDHLGRALHLSKHPIPDTTFGIFRL